VSLDPETHDGLMARSQALTFFLSRVLGRMELPDPTGPVGTRSYRDLRAALASVSRDTDELYHDLIRHNRHARRFLLDLERAVVAEQAALNTN
jgi:prephenate dehydrogenase